ncbi:hypothetical protein L9H26_07895 [Morganella psychrotolerans]|uniref:Uncharacterized protein n=1 Tax=Morganella psychrotolerans TaxID=368603 RepID=A0A5M9R9Q3_9GAMM|nr:hypothetical protein [Morganella psychrotolerans]KAA8716756.1 hypothetical protein F4V73_02450 [Morganella psychrotolerans]OBU08885.1 hypothetical protein AYY16_06605 [Morganella psychrotolerans]
MTIFFEETLTKMNNRLQKLDKSFERYLLSDEKYKCIDRYSLQEGLISSLWQTWCYFCREILIGSIKGGVTTRGINVSSSYFAHTEREIIYLAGRFSQGVTNVNGITIRSAPAHFELTWGDAVKLNPIISAFNPTNVNDILSGLGGITLLLDLQKFRNANAHITAFTINDVKNAQVRYSNTKFRHPSDTMFWVDPLTNDYLWRSWIEEMEITGNKLAS